MDGKTLYGNPKKSKRKLKLAWKYVVRASILQSFFVPSAGAHWEPNLEVLKRDVLLEIGKNYYYNEL